MRSGSVSRVRMIQPGDPIAYLRFIEGQARGIPGYDSGNVLTEHYSDDTYETPLAEQVLPDPITEPETTPPVMSGVIGPSYVLEPEWQNRTENIVNVGEETPETEIVEAEPVIEADEDEPEYIVEADEIYEDEPEYIADYEDEWEDEEYITEADEYEDEWDWEDEEYIAEEDEWEEEPEYIVEEDFEDEWEDEPEYIAEEEEIEEEPEYIAEEEEIEEEPEYIVEVIEEEEIEEEPEYIAEVIEEEEIEEEPEYIAEVIEEEEADEVVEEYTLVPTDERPPEYIYGIDPNDIIPEIVTQTPDPAPVQPPPVPVTPMDADFSVPRVSQLDQGWYYVQIAAMDSAESVQNTLNQIDLAYKPVVYSPGDSYYRILLGPLNQGESAAILARFRSIGYRDAFVRHARGHD